MITSQPTAGGGGGTEQLKTPSGKLPVGLFFCFSFISSGWIVIIRQCLSSVE
jgi:hypothetical protein